MLRTLALVLLVANALLLAALSGLFDAGVDSEREPERLQRQQQNGLVRILSPQAASAALDAASAAGAASLQAAAAASSALATVCLEAGPFSAADAAVAERSLHDAGLAPGSWQVQRHDDGGAFMIYMGRYADRETLQRKLAELKRLKLDAEDLRTAPALQPGIGLGHFDNFADANAALSQMAQRGLRTARVITLRQAQSQTLLRVAAADASQRARLAGLQLPSGLGFQPCATAAVPAPASSAAPASAPAAGSGPASAAVLAAVPAAATSAAPATVPASAPRPPPRSSAAAPAHPSAGASTRAALARAASAVAAESSGSAKR